MFPAILLTCAVPLVAAGEDTFEWQGSVGTGQTVEIKGVNGDVVAGPAPGGQVEVRAVKRGRRDDPADVRIEVVEHDDGVTLCAVYPDDRGKSNVCKPGGGGRLGANDNDVVVDFTVSVPAGVDLVGRTVNGGVEADSMDGNVDAATVNGNIDVSATGHVAATTVNGSIKASMGRTDWQGESEIRSVNGNITIELPDDASIDVSIKTLNGSIKSDFPIAIKGKFVGRRADGTIGSGGRGLEIESVNGSVKILMH
jgi:hypothetical protein